MSHPAALQCCYHFYVVQSKAMKLAIKIMHDETNICLVMQKADVSYRYSMKYRKLLSKSNSNSKSDYPISLSFQKAQILIEIPLYGPLFN